MNSPHRCATCHISHNTAAVQRIEHAVCVCAGIYVVSQEIIRYFRIFITRQFVFFFVFFLFLLILFFWFSSLFVCVSSSIICIRWLQMIWNESFSYYRLLVELKRVRRTFGQFLFRFVIILPRWEKMHTDTNLPSYIRKRAAMNQMSLNIIPFLIFVLFCASSFLAFYFLIAARGSFLFRGKYRALNGIRLRNGTTKKKKLLNIDWMSGRWLNPDSGSLTICV